MYIKKAKTNKSLILDNKSDSALNGERGSAMVIALLVMLLLMGFAALAISRTNIETIAASNDEAESRAFEAASASLEIMTRNFNKVFDEKMIVSEQDETKIKNATPPEFPGYNFVQEIKNTKNEKYEILTGTEYKGLYAKRTEWQFKTKVTETDNGTQVYLRRRFINNLIPIFQFGIFYNDDLEFHPGENFAFGGRVHTNSNLFMMSPSNAGFSLTFNSKVSAVGDIFTDIARNDTYSWNDRVFIKNASGGNVQLSKLMGSVLQNKTEAGGPQVYGKNNNADGMPVAYTNKKWKSEHEAKFDENLVMGQKPLELPIRFNNRYIADPPKYIELIRRGKSIGDLKAGSLPVKAADVDSKVLAKERYYNKTGFRIMLADSKAKLPGCAQSESTTAVTTKCGIRLDGAAIPGANGSEPATGSARGYAPLKMKDNYRATELNGERFYLGITDRQTWIKIETVVYDATTGKYVTNDITEEILSLGITDRPASVAGKFVIKKKLTGGTFDYGADSESNDAKKTDSRSIVKLQRFMLGDVKIDPSDTYMSNIEYTVGANKYYYNFVQPAEYNSSTSKWSAVDNVTVNLAKNAAPTITPTTHSGYGTATFGDHPGHWWETELGAGGNKTSYIVPFPINSFDPREALHNTSQTYPTGKVPWNGVMSMVDIDVNNLRRFLKGDFDDDFPTGTVFADKYSRAFESTDVPNSNGWVLFVSDRRGDYDFDGEYDMEDIYGNNDGTMQPGEDINDNGSLQADYCNEAVRYVTKLAGTNCESEPQVDVRIAALYDHKFYRRGVRLINAEVLPGKYDSSDPKKTEGFTVASENAVYVLGNYNATGKVNASATQVPMQPENYKPYNTENHIPASIVADALLILSNSWNDASVFQSPFSSTRKATESYYRFAMIAGDGRTTLKANGVANQGSGDAFMAGGVHNFKRFLENWQGVSLFYTGSIINMYDARNNNGSHKNDGKIYSPPVRDWTFDTSFLDPARLPPGTPFFQSISLTGFERIN